MKLFYWEDPAGFGWDVVVQADSEIAAKSLAKDKILGQTLPDESVKIMEAVEESRPTGIFNYPAALWIFTEHDPIESRISRQVLSKVAEQMRDRAAFHDSASLTRLLETWADVLDGKPDVGWAARNRGDLTNEQERVALLPGNQIKHCPELNKPGDLGCLCLACIGLREQLHPRTPAKPLQDADIDEDCR